MPLTTDALSFWVDDPMQYPAIVYHLRRVGGTVKRSKSCKTNLLCEGLTQGDLECILDKYQVTASPRFTPTNFEEF